MEQIRQAMKKDLPAIRALWELCFPSEGNFNSYFFQEIFSLQSLLLLEKDDVPQSMLQEIPVSLSFAGEKWSATYIYGACTAPEARGQGCMERLLKASFARDCMKGKVVSMLIPAETSLFDYYHRFGYETVFYQKSQTCSKQKIESRDYQLRFATLEDVAKMQDIYQTRQKGLYMIRDFSYWQGQIRMFQALGGQVFLLQKKKCCLGYAFVWPESDNLWVQEMVCRTQAEMPVFTEMIRQKFAESEIKITGMPEGDKQPFGMIKWHDTPLEYKEGYLNLLWN